MTTLRTRTLHAGAALTVALLALTGCGTSNDSASHAEHSTEAETQDQAVTLADGWVKTAEEGEMTAAFGILENHSDEDATLTSVTTPASSMVEIHETVADDSGQIVMREVEGGLVIPAHGQLALEPGGNHIMLMELPAAIAAGEEVTLTLTFTGGTTLEVTAVAKDYAGANENYDGGDDHDGMDHGEASDGGH